MNSELGREIQTGSNILRSGFRQIIVSAYKIMSLRNERRSYKKSKNRN